MNSPKAVDLNAPSDAELIAAVRGGDQAAYGELFERHRDAATRLARQIAGSSDADDLVSEAFIKVLNVLSAGGGPDLAFRAYLLTAVRRLHVDKIRRTSKVTPTDELESFDPGVPFADPAVQEFENVAASKAFASLPERWQLVLWHVEVEGQKPAEVAVLLGMSANSVSALAYRAREGLRQAYLQMHMADTAAEECRWVTERLGARVRNGLSRRDTVKVDEHLDECARCAAVYLELSEVNSNLAGILAPILLGAAASGYLGLGGLGIAGRRTVAVPGSTLRQGTRRRDRRLHRCERSGGHRRHRGHHHWFSDQGHGCRLRQLQRPRRRVAERRSVQSLAERPHQRRPDDCRPDVCQQQHGRPGRQARQGTGRATADRSGRLR